MSKDIIVVTPNGRRQKIHCTPDTSMLQVLEDVCEKQGFQPANYALKHHNHILDLTTTVRFSNLPNKAMIEMVETERQRTETNVIIGLLLEDGERRTAEFPPNTSLYDLVTLLAPTELNSLQHPSIVYMRQEVTGIPALKEKTLRQLGLLGGRAILRLLNKAEEVTQANISSVYRRSLPEKPISKDNTSTKIDRQQPTTSNDETVLPGPSNVSRKVDYKIFDPIKIIKEEHQSHSNKIIDKTEPTRQKENSICINDSQVNKLRIKESFVEIECDQSLSKSKIASNISLGMQKNLERRLKIEEEVTFLGTQKAIAFMQPEGIEDELEDLPDDFYELTIEEVRKLYHDLQQNRLELENTPLITTSKREELEKQTSEQKLSVYKNVVVRVQFPDHIILQGVFSPTNTIEDVTNFIKEHLQNPNEPFHIFTTPLKESLDPKMTLKDARFVPCVHMHFKWLQENLGRPYLKEEIYSKRTSSDAASILASKYRAPSRRKIEVSQENSGEGSSTTKSSKIPKWFKK